MADKEKEPELSEAELNARRVALESRLAQRRRAAGAPADDKITPGQSSSVALALRLSADFFSAVILGAALGIGFDKLMGTKPWGLAFLLIIGCIAGGVNVLRALGRPLPYQTALDKEQSGGRN